MDKIIDSILTLVYTAMLTLGSGHAIKKVYFWTRNAAFEKVAKGLGSLETSTRKMTGGKLDF